MFIIATNTE
jgi:hypothetical protein